MILSLHQILDQDLNLDLDLFHAQALKQSKSFS